MGKIQQPPSEALEQPFASSAASTSPFPAATDDDLPPSYSQTTNDSTSNQPNLRTQEATYNIPGGRPYNSIFQKHRHSGIATLYPEFSRDANQLADFIQTQTRLPPRPCLIVNGYHSETKNNGQKSESKSVTDFDFRIDLTETLLKWGRDERTGGNHEWSYTSVVSDTGGEKAYRGGRWPTRVSKTSGRIALPVDDDGDEVEAQRLMDLESGEEGPGIRGWCQRFCRDPAPVKSFTYRRNLSGFDVAPMRASFISHIRATGYRGNISIQPSISCGVITVYSPHWINNLRNNKFVYWMCIILQLWVITWPVIWFMERRYDVVRSEWFSSKTVCDLETERPKKVYAGGHDEATAAEIWAPVVREAAWRKRDGGCILEGPEIEQLRQWAMQRQAGAGESGQLIQRGQAVLGMMGIRNIAGIDVTGAWGGDDSSSRSGFSVRLG